MRRFSLRFVLLLLFGLLLYACRNEPGPVRLAPGVTAADYRTFFIQAVRAEGHRIDFEERFDTAAPWRPRAIATRRNTATCG